MKLSGFEIAEMRQDMESTELSMSCSIQRYEQTGTDPLGNPIMGWGTAITGIPCWYWEDSASQIIGDTNVTVTTSKVKLPVSTEIRDGDRIIDLVDRDNNTLPNLRVVEVLSRITFIVVTVERTS